QTGPRAGGEQGARLDLAGRELEGSSPAEMEDGPWTILIPAFVDHASPHLRRQPELRRYVVVGVDDESPIGAAGGERREGPLAPLVEDAAQLVSGSPHGRGRTLAVDLFRPIL